MIGGSIVHACRAAKIPRATHYYWLRVDPDYSAKFKAAREIAAQALEDEAIKRARYGVRRPVIHSGKQVMVFEDGVRKPLFEHEYSDTLLAMLLRAADPARFNPPKETINLLELDIELLTTPMLDKLLDHLLVKMVGPDPAAIEAARRDLAEGGGLSAMGTPATRVKEAADQLQAIIRRFNAAVAVGKPEVSDLMMLMADVRRVVQLLTAPISALETGSEPV